jgi:glycosyltransferase involved in cell wall biosynthesis
MAAFSQADAVLIPSVVDNFPNTALEAISNGAIVITSDTASLGSLIMDGQNGFILEDREPEEWISTIRKVLFGLGPEKIEKMKLSMKDSLLPHETGHAVEELEKYYNRIITGTYRANMQERKKRMKTRK